MLYDSASFHPIRNKLLAALPEFEWDRICRHLDPIDVSVGKTLCEAESRLDYAYFPTTAVISIVIGTADGVSTEIATIAPPPARSNAKYSLTPCRSGMRVSWRT
jgi:hypothetical protein